MHEAFVGKVKCAYNAATQRGCGFLFYMDVDEFHLINQRYGMESGDRLLSSIENFVAHYPNVAAYERVFSDQFVFLLLLPQPQTNDEVRRNFEERIEGFLVSEVENYPNIRLGISCGAYRLEGDNIELAVEAANLARKASKKRSSQGMVFFDSSVADGVSHYLEYEQEIADALRNNRFTFYLQPKVNLLTGEIIGAEALARRVDEGGRVKYPDSCLEIMEKNSSIVEMDFLVLRLVCEYISERRKNGLAVVPTSVNLSRAHTQNPLTALLLHKIVQSYKLPASLIEFELTESIMLDEFLSAKELIDELRGYGYIVSIDDFGSGYNSIKIWQELSFDTIKLDKSFLSDDPLIRLRNMAIVPNVINIVQMLNINTICEGVETEEQCRYLLKLGCTAIQGFYFSEPVPKEEFYKIFKEQNGRYACNFSNEMPHSVPPEPPKKPESIPKRWENWAGRMMVVVLVVTILTGGVFTALSNHRAATLKLFSEAVNNNLNIYTGNYVEKTDMTLSVTTTTLEAFSLLIGEQPTEELTGYIDTYLDVLNKNELQTVFQYMPMTEYEAREGNATTVYISDEVLAALQKGENAVTEIYYSNTYERYCFAIGCPVFTNGELSGALRAIVDAEVLVSDWMNGQLAYGSAEEIFVTDCDGQILFSTNSDKIGGSIAECLAEFAPDGSAEDYVSQGSRSFYIGERDGMSYYVSSSELPYNEWHTVVLFKADAIVEMQDAITENARILATTVAASILLSAILVGGWIIRLRRQLAEENKRYALLENFFGTVLFEYYLSSDSIRLTSNAGTIFNIEELETKNFVKELYNRQYIYYTDVPAVEDMLRGRMNGEKNEIRVRIRTANNVYHWCLISFMYSYGKGNKLESVIGKISDIDDSYHRELELQRNASRDGLTGLYNYAATYDLTNKALAEDQSGLLFVMDIDNFKEVNDTRGHDAGNELLIVIAECLTKVFRSSDIIGRIGGDELMVYMRGAEGLSVVQQRMRQFWGMLKADNRCNDTQVTVSVGISRFPEDGNELGELFRIADQAMYHAKNDGSGQFSYGGIFYPLSGEKSENKQ